MTDHTQRSTRPTLLRLEFDTMPTLPRYQPEASGNIDPNIKQASKNGKTDYA